MWHFDTAQKWGTTSVSYIVSSRKLIFFISCLLFLFIFYSVCENLASNTQFFYYFIYFYYIFLSYLCERAVSNSWCSIFCDNFSGVPHFGYTRKDVLAVAALFVPHDHQKHCWREHSCFYYFSIIIEKPLYFINIMKNQTPNVVG